MKIIVNTDGGCRFNSKDEPAEASAAFVATLDGTYLGSQSCLLTGTNNIAEYRGVYLAAVALPALVTPAITHVEFHCDAMLIVHQMNRTWAVRDPDMRHWSELCRHTLDKLGVPYSFKWIPREQNKEADLLCNLALDGKVKTELLTVFPHQNKNAKATCGQIFRAQGKLTTPRPMRVDEQGYALCNGCGQPVIRCTCPILEEISSTDASIEAPVTDLPWDTVSVCG